MLKTREEIMKKLISDLFNKLWEKIGGLMTDNVMDNDKDPFQRGNDEGIGGICVMVFLNLILVLGPYPFRLFGIFWPIIGLLVMHMRLGREAHVYKSDRWTELLIGLKTWTDVISMIYLWPLNLLLTMFFDIETNSFRSQVQSIYIDDLIQKVGRKDHAIDSARKIFCYDVKAAGEQSHALQEIPEQFVLTAKTTGACGATAMTLMTTAASAGGTPLTSTNSTVTTSSSGWVAVVNDSPIKGKPATTLRHARFRLGIDDSATHVGGFTEIDAEQLQYPDPDWLKQCYLTFNPATDTTFRAGRMFVAPGWSVPAPHSVETINYPRVPFSFAGYALQADLTRGQWHLLADVSGRTDLSFSDTGQFGRIEGSTRIERNLGTHYTVAWSSQASKVFTRTSFDVIAHPTGWLDMRAMIYDGIAKCSHGSSTTTAGGYVYVGVRPIPRASQLELHTQVDTQEMWRGKEAQPVTLTEGVRWKTDDNKYSATLDYQHSLGAIGASNSDGVFLRLQRRF